MAGETLDLRSAAEQLGVHYQTAYKWVRSGVLASTLVRGRYHVSPEAVVALARRRDSPSRPRARRPRGGYEQARERMFIHLISGEERKARDLISGLVDSGVTVTNATQEVLVPALRRIGQEWDAGGSASRQSIAPRQSWSGFSGSTTLRRAEGAGARRSWLRLPGIGTGCPH